MPHLQNYILKRIIRIYPLYFATMVYMFYVNRTNPITAVFDLLMIQSWVPIKSVYFSGNAPLWFISDLMFFYILTLPIVNMINRHWRYLILIMSIGIVFYFFVVAIIPEKRTIDFIYVNPLMQLPVFVIGMLLWPMFTKSVGFYCEKQNPNILLILSVGIISVYCLCYGKISPRLAYCSYWWIPSALLITSFVTVDRLATNGRISIASKLLRWQPAVTLGNISFSIYMLHIPWISTTRILMHKLNVSVDLVTELIISLPCLILISYFVEKKFVEPITQYLDMRLNKQKSDQG